MLPVEEDTLLIREEAEEVETPILQNIEEIDPLFKTFNSGFGTTIRFPFISKNDNQIEVGLNTLLLESNLKNNFAYQDIKNVNIDAFEKVQTCF